MKKINEIEGNIFTEKVQPKRKKLAKDVLFSESLTESNILEFM